MNTLKKHSSVLFLMAFAIASVIFLLLAQVKDKATTQNENSVENPLVQVERGYTNIDMDYYMGWRKPLVRVVSLTLKFKNTDFKIDNCMEAVRMNDPSGKSYISRFGLSGGGISQYGWPNTDPYRRNLYYYINDIPVSKELVGKITFKTAIVVNGVKVPLISILEHHP